MKIATDLTLSLLIRDSISSLTLVWYTAPWCAPCVQLGRLLESLELTDDRVQVLKINIDDNPVAGLDKTSIPVVEFYSRGRFLDRKIGLISRRQLTQLVDSFLASAV